MQQIKNQIHREIQKLLDHRQHTKHIPTQEIYTPNVGEYNVTLANYRYYLVLKYVLRDCHVSGTLNSLCQYRFPVKQNVTPTITWRDLLNYSKEIIQIEKLTPSEYFENILDNLKTYPESYTTPITDPDQLIFKYSWLIRMFTTETSTHVDISDLIGDKFKYVTDGNLDTSHTAFKIGNGEMIDWFYDKIPQSMLLGKRGGRNILNHLSTVENIPQIYVREDTHHHLSILECALTFFDSGEAISEFMVSLYFEHKASAWFNGDLRLKGRCGRKVYVHPHTVLEWICEDFDDISINWDVHPKEWFAEELLDIADDALSMYDITRPEHLRYKSNIPNVRELVTGHDLRECGEFMKHCIGGESYLRGLLNWRVQYFQIGNSTDPKDYITVEMINRKPTQTYTYRNGEVTADHPMYLTYLRLCGDVKSSSDLQSYISPDMPSDTTMGQCVGSINFNTPRQVGIWGRYRKAPTYICLQHLMYLEIPHYYHVAHPEPQRKFYIPSLGNPL